MDAEAERRFDEFVEARSLSLRRIAYALCGDGGAAEDLVQGALTKLFRHWHKIDDPDRYVRRIIYNDQVSIWRRKARMREHPVSRLPELGVEDTSGQVDVRLDLLRALYRLGRRQRTVLILRFYFDLPDEEIAEAMGCSRGTVRSQALRGLARLRELVPELDSRQPVKEDA